MSLQRSACCRCAASNSCPGLVSSQYLFSIKCTCRRYIRPRIFALPGWSCAASYLFITSHTAEYPM
eukprot:1143182-Pelagomonas_calceolata.AAC.1